MNELKVHTEKNWFMRVLWKTMWIIKKKQMFFKGLLVNDGLSKIQMVLF